MPARPMRRNLLRLSLLIVCCIQAAPLFAAKPDAKLLGVRVDCSDTLLDAQGKEVGKILLGYGSLKWDLGRLRRDFIFELPPGEPILPIGCKVMPAGVREPTGSWMGGGRLRMTGDSTRRLLIVEMELYPAYRERGKEAALDVESVDLTLSYFAGPRGKALVSFSEPFEINKPKAADGGFRAELLLTPNNWNSDLIAHLTVHEQMPEALTTLYEKSGKRRNMNQKIGDSSPGQPFTFQLYECPPISEIDAVTFGEQPVTKTFRSVRVLYPDVQPRTYPVSIYGLAERLGLLDNVDSLINTDFLNPDQIVAGVDLLRGPHIKTAVRMFTHHAFKVNPNPVTGKYDPIVIAKLDPPANKRFHDAASSWAASPDEDVCSCGIAMGLLGEWLEFAEPAFALIAETEDETASSRVMEPLSRLADRLDDEQVKKAAAAIPRVKYGPSRFSLIHMLGESRLPSATNLLLELAASDQPGVWWRAIEQLDKRNALPQLPPELKARAFLVLGPEKFPAERDALAAKAREMLPGLLTVQFERDSPGMARLVLDAAIRYLDRQTATDLMISFMRGLHNPRESHFDVEKMVKQINEWNGINISLLGTNQKETSNPQDYDWPTVVADVSAWRETGVDPGVAARQPAKAQPRDLRVILLSTDDPEQSIIALWRFGDDPAARPREFRFQKGGVGFGFRLWGREGKGKPGYMCCVSVGRSGLGRQKCDGFTDAGLPRKINYFVFPDEHQPKERQPFRGEVWIERATAGESVLGNAKVFQEWWAACGTSEGN